jgi:hypothetical protein
MLFFTASWPSSSGTAVISFAQHEALLACPSAHYVQRRLIPPMVERAPDRLAVDGDHLALKARCERADPGREP